MPDQNSPTTPPDSGVQPNPQQGNPLPDETQMPSQPPTIPTDDIAAPVPPEPAGSAAPPFDIPPVVTPPEKPKDNRKVVATILGILVLIGGIGAGIVLVRQQQLFQQKAWVPEDQETFPGGPQPGEVPGEQPPTETGGGTELGGSGSSGGGGCSEGATEANNSGGINYCSSGKWYSCPAGQAYVNGQCQSAPPAGGGQGSGGGSSGFGTSCGTRTISSCAPGKEVTCVNGSWQCVTTAPAGGTTATVTTGTCPTGTIPQWCEEIAMMDCLGEGQACPSRADLSSCTSGQVPKTCPGVGIKCLGPNEACPVYEVGGTCGTGSPGWTSTECSSAGGTLGSSSGGGLYCCNFPTSWGCTSGSPGWTPPECGMAGGTVGAPSQQGGGLYCCSFPSTVPEPPVPKSGQTTPTIGAGEGPSPTLPPGMTAQCLNIKAFDSSWNQLTVAQLSNLKVGDTVRFSVAGQASTGTFDRAKFTINGTARAEVTQVRPGTQEFYDEYVIPSGTTSFSVSAQVHNTVVGWF